MIVAKRTGNIAEAALQLNGVFESVQAAAQQYLENIQYCSGEYDRLIADAKKRCEEMERDAEAKTATLKAEIARLMREKETLTLE